MKNMIITLLSILCSVGISANNQTDDLNTCTEYANEFSGFASSYKAKTRVDSPEQNSEEWISAEVKVENPGDLRNLLGESLLDINELIVSGIINDDDFRVFFEATFYGKLKVLDLGKAMIENGEIPDFAFRKYEEQLVPDCGYFYPVLLEKVILPYNTERIGRFAFESSNLKEITFPDCVKIIDDGAFTYCRNLEITDFPFLRNLEKIGTQAFAYCHKLNGKAIFPDGLKTIKLGAFHQCKFSEIYLPESLEFLGGYSLTGNCFPSIVIPDNCQLDAIGYQLSSNYYLEQIKFPSKCEIIPTSFAEYCPGLSDVAMPEYVETIDIGAFENCSGLRHISFPEGLKHLRQDSFNMCNLTEIVLPSTLEKIDGQCFAGNTLVIEIRSKAIVPPVCDSSAFPNKQVPLYVPKGSEDAYRNAPGWNFFTTIIGTDFSEVEIYDATRQDEKKYDLNGKEIINSEKGIPYIKAGKVYINR